MAGRRNALEKHLGISEEDHSGNYARDRALIEHVGEALTAENYAAAQVYALLLIAERLDAGTSDVSLTNAAELAGQISSSLEPDLRRIADAIG